MATKVSIIVSCFNNSKTATHMSMLCIDHIRKFTDPPYELIIIDPTPKFPIRDDYGTLKLKDDPDTNHVILSDDPGYAKGMNLGAKLSSGDVLVFIQNDVFVHEDWLKGLLWYIDEGYEAVFPDQVPRDRNYILNTYLRLMKDPDSRKGGRDAGLLIITREAFDRAGGWDDDTTLLAEAAFYKRMGDAGVKWTDTNKVQITHIMAATNLDLLENNPEEYDRRMSKDAQKLNG